MSVGTRVIGNAGGTRTKDVEYGHWMRNEMKAGLQVAGCARDICGCGVDADVGKGRDRHRQWNVISVDCMHRREIARYCVCGFRVRVVAG